MNTLSALTAGGISWNIHALIHLSATPHMWLLSTDTSRANVLDKDIASAVVASSILLAAISGCIVAEWIPY